MATPCGFNISVDLQKEAAGYWAFLKEVQQTPALRQNEVLQAAVWRYETKWLPLVAKQSQLDMEELEPPLDVHWVWHIHMLSPTNYVKDCMALVKTVPNHKFHIEEKEHQGVLDKTRLIWNKMYPLTMCIQQFDLDYNLLNTPDLLKNFKSSISYNIVSAASRQAEFFYHVSLPHYTDSVFLAAAVKRYKKFVGLKKIYPEAFIVPMYDIRLVWHTHQLYPHSYRRDMENFLGQVMSHDDATSGQCSNSMFSQSDTVTRLLWNEAYGEPFAQPGTMHRGTPPYNHLLENTEKYLESFITRTCQLLIEQVTFHHDDRTMQIGADLIHSQDGKKQTSSKLPSIRNEGSYSWQSEGNALFQLQLKTNYTHQLKVCINQKGSGIKGLFGGRNVLGEVVFDLNKMVDDLETRSDQAPMRVECTDKVHEGKLTVCADIYDLTFDMPGLHLMAGKFQNVVIPLDTAQSWGPISLPPLPPGVGNVCNVALHKLYCHNRLALTCRVFHSMPLRMSGIQVFYKNKMAVVAHLVGSDQLPRKEQVGKHKENIVLRQDIGERAMVIKNNQGDWGIVKACWSGFQRRKPPRKDVKCVTGNPGFLLVAFYHLLKGTQDICFVWKRSSRPGEKECFSIGGVSVDIPHKKLETSGSDVAESVALAFSVLTLFVLCMPRPEITLQDNIAGTTGSAAYKTQGYRVAEKLKVGQYEFFKAVGYDVDTPSNNWIYWNAFHDRGPEAKKEHAPNGGPLCDNRDIGIGDSSFCPWHSDGTDDLGTDTESGGGDGAYGGGMDSDGSLGDGTLGT